MQVNLNTPSTISTAASAAPSAPTKPTATSVQAPSAADTVTLSAEAKAKLAAEAVGGGWGNEPPMTTMGNGSGNEPPMSMDKDKEK